MAKNTKAPATKNTKAPANPAQTFNAKVKGENKWLAHDGTKFFISENKEDATEFSAGYVSKIITSNWGGKKWESKKA